MTAADLLPMLQNAAMLMAMVLVYDVAKSRYRDAGSHTIQILNGICIGAIGLLIMLTPMQYAPGIIFDTRSILLGLSGLFFGLIPTLVAMLITAIGRFYLGGAAAWSGVIVVLSSGAFGLLWRYFRKRELTSLKPAELFGFGIGVHLLMIVLLLTLPSRIAVDVMAAITIPVMLIYPPVTLLVGMLMVSRLRHRQLEKYLEENDQRLRLALSASNQGLFDIDLRSGEIEADNSHLRRHGQAGLKLHRHIDDWLAAIHPEERDRLRTIYDDCVAGRISGFREEFRQCNAAGAWLWIFAAARLAAWDEKGRPLRLLGTHMDITSRKQAAEKLRIFRALIDTSIDGIEVIDPETARFLDVNDSACRELGYSREECLQLTVFDLDPKLDHAKFQDSMKTLRQDGFLLWEGFHTRKDGSRYPVEVNLKHAVVEREYLVAVVRNITLRKQSEDALKLAALVFQHSREGMLVTDTSNRIIDANPTFSRVTGYSREEVLGQTPALLKSGRQSDQFYQELWAALHHQGHWSGEIWNRRKNGEIYPEWLSINAVYNDQGQVERWVSQFSDISDKRDAEQMIWHQANYDVLTGLPNRRMFYDRLDQEIKHAQRTRQGLALLFLDLDHFKEVNDTLGHSVGDMLLRQAAERLRKCLRESDTIARLGGDEFMLILGGRNDASLVGDAAQKVLWTLAEPFHLSGKVAYVSSSIGITLYPEDARDIESLLKNADQAMYRAKRDGRNRYQYFTPALQAAVTQRMEMTNDLREALANGHLSVAYQPIVELASGKILKAEALIRWQHPLKGAISPAQFIPIAEETGLINAIGDIVFQDVLIRAKRWRQIQPHFQISFNRSPVQFSSHWQPDHEGWLAALSEAGLPGRSIAVEITEGLLLDARPYVHEQLLALRDAEVEVAIDDFGTGYSSLSYLRKFSIDYLKIDRSFVSNLGPDSEDMAVCEAIITMAHRLGLKVIAEGVETLEQQALLLMAGCDLGQGFVFSKAVAAREFEALLDRDCDTAPQSSSIGKKNETCLD
ncbi:MAG: EAL domain-containing protein [Pseudomonadales bacterium]|nr:EAL domain-containing protein [Pseudomonadales bacterium]